MKRLIKRYVLKAQVDKENDEVNEGRACFKFFLEPDKSTGADCYSIWLRPSIILWMFNTLNSQKQDQAFFLG